MLLGTLQAIALTKNYTFLYGESDHFNTAANETDVIESDQTLGEIIMYHEGYITSTVVRDDQGIIEPAYQLQLYLLVQSQKQDTPEMRRPRFEMLEPRMWGVINELWKANQLTNILIREGANMTTRNLDGLYCTMNAKPKYLDREPC
jgi:hypothetical protein